MKLRNHKRGATQDNFFVVVQFFGFAIFLLVMYVAWSAFTSSDLDEDLWQRSRVGTAIRNNAQVAFDNWDWVTMFVYFALHIGVVVLAFLLRSHPIVYVAGILLIAILIIVSVPLSNSWEDITGEDIRSDGDLAIAVTNIPKVDYIMGRLPIFEAIWGFITLIVLAGMARTEGYL